MIVGGDERAQHGLLNGQMWKKDGRSVCQLLTAAPSCNDWLTGPPVVTGTKPRRRRLQNLGVAILLQGISQCCCADAAKNALAVAPTWVCLEELRMHNVRHPMPCDAKFETLAWYQN